jgi:hypothetical protein
MSHPVKEGVTLRYSMMQRREEKTKSGRKSMEVNGGDYREDIGA